MVQQGTRIEVPRQQFHTIIKRNANSYGNENERKEN
jgi:hypothetical protein